MKIFLCLSLIFLFGWRASATLGNVQLPASGAKALSIAAPGVNAGVIATGEKGADSQNFKGKKKRLRVAKGFSLAQKRFLKRFAAVDGSEDKFNLGGFLLGLALPLIGPLGAYLFTKNRNFIRWAWIGTGVYVVLVLIVALAYLGKMT